MKTNYIIPEVDTAELHSFIKQDVNSQLRTLKEKAIMLDQDSENGQSTILYFLKGFYVEETFSILDNKVIDIVPFKRGFKVERFLKEKGLLAFAN
jgi:hypothetical protein